MKVKRLWMLALLLILTILSTTVSVLVRANVAPAPHSYRRIATMSGPNIPPHSSATWAFDISWVDQATQRYDLAGGSLARVDIFDARTNSYIGAIEDSLAFMVVGRRRGPLDY